MSIILTSKTSFNDQVNLGVLRQRMSERVAACSLDRRRRANGTAAIGSRTPGGGGGGGGAICPPLSWTISNRLLDLAPAVLRWYYDQAAQTAGTLASCTQARA